MQKTYSYHFDALISQCPCRWLGDIAADTSNLELFGEHGIFENVFNDGAALVASGTENSYDLRHDGLLLLRIKYCKCIRVVLDMAKSGYYNPISDDAMMMGGDAYLFIHI